MKAHILAHFIEDPKPAFPFLCLTVSGGHTQIVLVHDFLKMEVIGETQDDAVGEAFDKSAKLLGLPYPGGPLIDRYAQKGNPKAFDFPRTEMPGLDFSFSGIKTAFLYFLRNATAKDPDFVENNMADICASYQSALVSTLMRKLEKAAKQLNIRHVAIAGGVSANSGLRQAMEEAAIKNKWQVYVPKFEYCTDNAAMVAITAHYMYKEKMFCGIDASPLPRMKI
jgi:N6-L-threonylcarbamoyladenine synthase